MRGIFTRLLRKHDISPALVIVEVLSIGIAIFLGFAVTEWRQARDGQARADEALRSIAGEMEKNRAAVAIRLPYYRQIGDEIHAAIRAAEAEGRDPDIPVSDLESWRGLWPPIFRSSSYEVAQSTGALVRVPFETADALAFAYELQGTYQAMVNAVLQGLLSGEIGEAEDWLRAFRYFEEVGGLVAEAYDSAGTKHLASYGYAIGEPEGDASISEKFDNPAPRPSTDTDTGPNTGTNTEEPSP